MKVFSSIQKNDAILLWDSTKAFFSLLVNQLIRSKVSKSKNSHLFMKYDIEKALKLHI